MGLLKRLFQGGAAEEKGSSGSSSGISGPSGQGENPVSRMDGDEKLDYWGQACRLSDPDQRLRRLEPLAESGFDAAWISMIDAYLELARQQGTDPPFERVEYCARKAADAGIPDGHSHLGMLCGSPLYGEYDPAGAAREFLLAIEGGSELAVRLLLDCWNREFHEESFSKEENARITALFHNDIKEALKPEIERLAGEDGRETCTAFGFLYFYGIYFEPSLSRAKEYFTRLSEMGSSLGRRMLENPVFDDDDDDDEDDEEEDG